MFPSKFLQFPSILTHFHAANEKIQNGGRDLAISRGLVWVKINGANTETFSLLQSIVDTTKFISSEQGRILFMYSPGARPTKHISIEFEIRWKFKTL